MTRSASAATPQVRSALRYLGARVSTDRVNLTPYLLLNIRQLFEHYNFMIQDRFDLDSDRAAGHADRPFRIGDQQSGTTPAEL
jgi:hypothetical protein